MGSAAGLVSPGFPLVDADGTSYDLGWAHGRQCAELIRHLARVGMPRYLACAPEEMWVSRGNPCLAGYRDYTLAG